MESNVEYPKHVKINTTDLELAIKEGCNPMQRLLDPSCDNLPYMVNCMSGLDPKNEHHAIYSMAHVPGRWLNALLNAEDAVGIDLDEQVVCDLARWTYRAFDHPMGISQTLDLKSLEPIPVSDLHNLRETTHALYSLVKYRDEKKALEIVRKQIETVNRFYDFETGVWNEKVFNQERGGRTNAGEAPFPVQFGRYIGPLVKLYKAYGVGEALIQAIRIKEFTFKNILNKRGDFDVNLFGNHIHSITSMISSLAQLGELLSDNTTLERVMAFMENGFHRIGLEFGWSPESYERTDLFGEINSTGDILETCLILGKAGYIKYFQQAERILRAHLLPAQLLDVSFIPDWDCPKEDYHHRLATRARGTFGFPCPYGHEYRPNSHIAFNWDIVGGAVGSLCEVFRDKVTKSGPLVSINLHFDHKDDYVEVKSPYTNNDVMEIKLKYNCLIRIRLSDWVNKDKLSVTVNNKRTRAVFSGDWLYLPNLRVNSVVKVKIPMKTTTINYNFRSDAFSLRWRGDAVDGASNPADGRLLFFRDI